MDLLHEKRRALSHHPLVAAAMIGSAVVGGVVSSQAAGDAADAQVQSSQNALNLQKGMFDTQMGLQSPYVQMGYGAGNKLSYLLGTSPTGYGGSSIGATASAMGAPSAAAPSASPSGAGYSVDEGGAHFNPTGAAPSTGTGNTDAITQAYHDYLGRDPEAAGLANWQQDMSGGMTLDQMRQNIAASPEAQLPHAAYTTPGQQAATAAAGDPAYGSLLHNFGTADFQEDPGIQFQTQQGNLALQNSQAAKDGVLSGAALKDLIGYNSGMAATGYQSAYDRYVTNQSNTYQRLMGLTGVGQAAASNASSNAGAASGAMANTITGAGNAQASGIVGSANALSGGLTGAGNSYLLSSLLKNGGTSGIGTSPTGAGTNMSIESGLQPQIA